MPDDKIIKYTPHKNVLAPMLGITRVTLDKILRAEDAPKKDPKKGYDVLLMIKFMRIWVEREGGTKLKNRGNDKIGVYGDSITDLKIRELTAKVGKLEFQLEKERGSYILKSVWASQLNGLMQETNTTFRRAFEQELPTELHKLAPNDIRAMLRKTYTEVLSDLHKRAAKIG